MILLSARDKPAGEAKHGAPNCGVAFGALLGVAVGALVSDPHGTTAEILAMITLCALLLGVAGHLLLAAARKVSAARPLHVDGDPWGGFDDLGD